MTSRKNLHTVTIPFNESYKPMTLISNLNDNPISTRNAYFWDNDIYPVQNASKIVKSINTCNGFEFQQELTQESVKDAKKNVKKTFEKDSLQFNQVPGRDRGVN